MLMRSRAYPSLSAIASANTRTRVRVRVSMLSSARAFNSDLASWILTAGTSPVY